jgi:hypothetical protein
LRFVCFARNSGAGRFIIVAAAGTRCRGSNGQIFGAGLDIGTRCGSSHSIGAFRRRLRIVSRGRVLCDPTAHPHRREAEFFQRGFMQRHLRPPSRN